MPNLNTQFPNINDLFSLPTADLWEMPFKQSEMAQRNDALNREGALEELAFSKANNPQLLRHQQLLNQTSEAELPGRIANSSVAQDNAAISRQTLDPSIKKKLSDIALGMKDNELKSATTALEAGLISKDPEERRMAQILLPQLKEVQIQRIKDEADYKKTMDAQRLQNSGSLAVAQENANASRYATDKRKGPGGSASEAALVGKMTYDKQAGYYAARAQEVKEENPDLAAYYLQMSNAASVAFERAKLLGGQQGQTGSVDLEAQTDGQVKTRPAPQPQPLLPQGAPPPPAPKPSSLADVQKMYPGVPPEKLKELYKKKFGVDLQ